MPLLVLAVNKGRNPRQSLLRRDKLGGNRAIPIGGLPPINSWTLGEPAKRALDAALSNGDDSPGRLLVYQKLVIKRPICLAKLRAQP